MENALVVRDETMGRCLASRRDFGVGDIIFWENSIVFSSYDGKNRHEATLLKAAFPKSILKNLTDILDDMSSLVRVQSLDTAKNFILLLAIEILRSSGDMTTVTSYFESIGITSRECAEKLNLLDELSAANLEECISDVKSIRTSYPKLIPKSIATNVAAKLLGVVNTNQLELEELGGSGLFVFTAILQHDCSPNCSFTTNGSQLFLTSILPISAGDRLSIDYGNNFYTPTMDRIESLHESYGFECCCSLCLGPDRKRAYRCADCDTGLFYPIGSKPVTESFTSCTICSSQPSISHRTACFNREEHFRQSPPTSLAATQAAVAEKLLADSHYTLFWALDDTYNRLSGEASSALRKDPHSSLASRLYTQALEVLQESYRLLEIQLPSVHHEKVVYLDKLGQLALANKSFSLSQQYFCRAFEHSCLCSGPPTSVPATASIHKLVLSPPTSLAELVAHYTSRGAAGDEEDEDEWEDVEEDA